MELGFAVHRCRDFEVRDIYGTLAQPLSRWASLHLGSEIIVAVILVSQIAARKAPLRPLFSGLFAMLALYWLVALASTSW
jgi:hypothetical protein